MHKFNLRLTAIFLLLVLVQSMGVRLMLHNKYHQVSPISLAKTSSAYIQSPCDCLDDCLTPSTHAQAIEIAVPATEHAVVQIQHVYTLSSFEKVFHSLRAPPAI